MYQTGLELCVCVCRGSLAVRLAAGVRGQNTKVALTVDPALGAIARRYAMPPGGRLDGPARNVGRGERARRLRVTVFVSI